MASANFPCYNLMRGSSHRCRNLHLWCGGQYGRHRLAHLSKISSSVPGSAYVAICCKALHSGIMDDVMVPALLCCSRQRSWGRECKHNGSLGPPSLRRHTYLPALHSDGKVYRVRWAISAVYEGPICTSVSFYRALCKRMPHVKWNPIVLLST